MNTTKAIEALHDLASKYPGDAPVLAEVCEFIRKQDQDLTTLNNSMKVINRLRQLAFQPKPPS